MQSVDDRRSVGWAEDIIISLHVNSAWLARIKQIPLAAYTRAHHRDEKPERDLTYHLTCLLIYHGTHL